MTLKCEGTNVYNKRVFYLLLFDVIENGGKINNDAALSQFSNGFINRLPRNQAVVFSLLTSNSINDIFSFIEDNPS